MAPSHERAADFDVVFVGGGLASVLASLALLERRPELRLAIVERGARLGGNHTWCFHAADVPASASQLVAPLIVQSWPGYEVRFPRRTRRLASGYACISSARLHEVGSARFGQAPGSELLLGQSARELGADRVLLDDGRELAAKLVVDARGPTLGEPSKPEQRGRRGYQKFVGLELRVAPHTLREPLMFDACIEQRDGFRFMYVLPLSSDRVLVEETFFSEHARLDEESGRRAILEYAAKRGLSVLEVLRVERGVLPMPWHDPPFDIRARPLAAGYRAGLFHPVTGYSFPLAIRFALALAASDLARLESSPLAAFARAHAEQRPFLHFLTRLLFTCFAPAQRFSVLEHFYRLPEPVIERFYAAELRPLDRARVFIGAPPRGFSVGRAFGFQSGVAE
ncbi:MAG: Lycopene cyclase protein [Myxococcaceae bacterium]|nr:Lycopene cyclase protein [Myxococcaceae bacterium]